MDCPNKAEYLYSWNGELIVGCKDHAMQMKTVADAMGIPIELKFVIGDQICMHKEEKKEE